jgi:hypothetical protein
MLSRVPVSNVVSSVIYGSFTVDALLSLHLLSFSLFSATGVCVYYYFYLITPASLDYFLATFATLANFAIGLDSLLIHCIIITRIFPFVA